MGSDSAFRGWVGCIALVRLEGLPSWRVLAMDLELGPAGNGGLVDPIPGDGLGEHINGGLVPFGDHVGMVVITASRHGGVDAATVGVCSNRNRVHKAEPTDRNHNVHIEPKPHGVIGRRPLENR